ncbi:hypothetical protein R3I94_011066 [Phoxinus phoxinus]
MRKVFSKFNTGTCYVVIDADAESMVCHVERTKSLIHTSSFQSCPLCIGELRGIFHMLTSQVSLTLRQLTL